MAYRMQWSPHDNTHLVTSSASELALYAVAGGRPEVPAAHLGHVTVEMAPQLTAHMLTLVRKLGPWGGGKTVGLARAGVLDSTRAEGTSLLATDAHLRAADRQSERVLRCFDWCLDKDESNRMMVAIGTSTGTCFIASFAATTGDGLMKEFAPQHAHPCNDIAWNPVNTNLLAVGLDKVRSGHCALVWDVNQKGGTFATAHHKSRPVVRTPTFTLSYSEAVSSLAWLPDSPECLATGGGFKMLRVYDTRASATPVSSTQAHNKAVRGVCFDVYRPYAMATHSDDAVVKLWDIRRLHEPTSVITTPSASVADVAWCPTKPGLLATTGRDQPQVLFWNVAGDATMDTHDPVPPPSPSTRVQRPFTSRPAADAVEAFAWQRHGMGSAAVAPNVDALRTWNRVTVLTAGKTMEDLIIAPAFPITFSPHGDLAVGCGTSVVAVRDPFVSSAPGINDGMTYMLFRLEKGYGLAPMGNHRLLLQLCVDRNWNVDGGDNSTSGSALLVVDADTTASPTEAGDAGDVDAPHSSARDDVYQEFVNLRDLQAMWAVVARATVLPEPKEHHRIDSGEGAPTGGLIPAVSTIHSFEQLNRGVVHIASAFGASSRRHLRTDFTMYDSRVRSVVSSMCGWIHDAEATQLKVLVQACESAGRTERAAALAVFHGDLSTAVAVLQVRAGEVTDTRDKVSKHATREMDVALVHELTAEMELLQLVAMTIAGFPASPGKQADSLWLTLNTQLCDRLGSRHPYLHALCAFLGQQYQEATGAAPSAKHDRHGPWTSSGYAAVLRNDGLALADRVAFAARFLPDHHLTSYLPALSAACVKAGRMEGILLTGLREEGLKLMQAYLDRTGDIQTVGLLSCYVTSNLDDASSLHDHEMRLVKYWISTYRDLLNRWRQWHARARFDVARNKLASHRRETMPGATVEPKPEPRASSEGVLQVTCTYCKSALSLEKLVASSAGSVSWLSGQRPKMLICPSCRKPLPRCSLCLLNMGCINPFLQLQHDLHQRSGGAGSSTQAGAGASASSRRLGSPKLKGEPAPPVSPPLGGRRAKEDTPESGTHRNAMPFADWWTWCQTCRHGGHATHLAEWFSTHTICPVAGCMCHCTALDFVPPPSAV